MSAIDQNVIVSLAIKKAIDNKNKFFAYKLPDSQIWDFGAEGDIKKGRESFLIHPFILSDFSSEVIIRKDYNAVDFLELDITLPICDEIVIGSPIKVTKEQYLNQVTHIIKEIKNGNFKKVVLSYPIYENIELSSDDIVASLKRLTKENPNAFIFIYNSVVTGFWMGASPENFLSFDEGKITTMALAGTRKSLSESINPWGEKEKEEQDIVASYIDNILRSYGLEIDIDGPFTLKAGYVEHICTRFTAKVGDNQIANILKNLHPTPALAGVSTKEVVDFINKIEYHKRKYYGGYIGPIYSNGNFKFYVNLRSMNFDNSHQCIYVGGGITGDSIPEDEWKEIMEKASTLKKILEA